MNTKVVIILPPLFELCWLVFKHTINNLETNYTFIQDFMVTYLNFIHLKKGNMGWNALLAKPGISFNFRIRADWVVIGLVAKNKSH